MKSGRQDLWYGLANVWGHKKGAILQVGTDKMIPRYAFNKTFMVRFFTETNGKMGSGKT
jgi:hypothetical protein